MQRRWSAISRSRSIRPVARRPETHLDRTLAGDDLFRIYHLDDPILKLGRFHGRQVEA